MTHEFTALGTKWWIEIFDEISPQALNDAFGIIERFTHDFEKKYSRFKADSLISTLNRERILKNPDEESRALLAYGKQLYLRTNTHFNMLTGHLQEARGYDASYSFVPHESEMLFAGNPVTDLLISPQAITLLHGKVDIGGFGKGYLIDELANILREECALQYFLINGGGDIYATTKHGEPLEIVLEHPTQPAHFIHTTSLSNQGFAASSPFKRVWRHYDKTYTHIITNTEAPQVASFVKAATARDADAFATTALLLFESELSNLAAVASLGIARFTPTTNQFWSTKSFEHVEGRG